MEHVLANSKGQFLKIVFKQTSRSAAQASSSILKRVQCIALVHILLLGTRSASLEFSRVYEDRNIFPASNAGRYCRA